MGCKGNLAAKDCLSRGSVVTCQRSACGLSPRLWRHVASHWCQCNEILVWNFTVGGSLFCINIHDIICILELIFHFRGFYRAFLEDILQLFYLHCSPQWDLLHATACGFKLHYRITTSLTERQLHLQETLVGCLKESALLCIYLREYCFGFLEWIEYLHW